MIFRTNANSVFFFKLVTNRLAPANAYSASPKRLWSSCCTSRPADDFTWIPAFVFNPDLSSCLNQPSWPSSMYWNPWLMAAYGPCSMAVRMPATTQHQGLFKDEWTFVEDTSLNEEVSLRPTRPVWGAKRVHVRPCWPVARPSFPLPPC